ncbi:hypothetical protein [Actinacidiphila oryziradicis]|nr:hypothetical protein [Actinacidiphila oryziradicis]
MVERPISRQLLAAKGVTDERVIEVILHLTGRLPVLVDPSR